MMNGKLSIQHSHNTVFNDESNVVLVLFYNVDLAQHSKHYYQSFLYISGMMNNIQH